MVNGQNKTFDIPTNEIKTANQIFIEHKNQIKIINIKDSLIFDLKQKDTLKTKLINNKDLIIEKNNESLKLSEDKTTIIQNSLTKEVNKQKAIKNTYKVISIVSIIAVILSIIK